MKKLTLILVLCAAMLFSGCAVITNILDPLPDEYVDGVKVPREYPDDDFEIYDDAIVFEADGDDEEISLKFGTEDEIDDVIDFYLDLFEDNEMIIEEQDEGRNDFFAKGMGDGFEFEIEAMEAEGNYEERAFATIGEINIEFYEVGEAMLQKMQGFWLGCGANGDISDAVRQEGLAIDFRGTAMDFYALFEVDTLGNVFTFVDDDTIHYTEQGTEYTVDVVFETIGGIDVMTMSSEGQSVNFEKSSHDKMMGYEPVVPDVPDNPNLTAPVYLDDNLSDAELEYWITDVNWYFIAYIYSDGSYEEAEEFNRTLLYSDYTGEDETTTGTEYITWYVDMGDLVIAFSDGEVYWPIDFEYDGTDAYLYFYDLDEGYEGGYWIYYAE